MPKKYSKEKRDDFERRLAAVKARFDEVGTRNDKYAFIRFHNPEFAVNPGRDRLYNTFNGVSRDFGVLEVAEKTLDILEQQRSKNVK